MNILDHKAYLLALDSSFSSRKYWIEPGGAIVGRDSSLSTIIAAGPTISRRHVEITSDEKENRYILTDLDSTNGVYVNGVKTTKCFLANGDVICLGAPSHKHLQFFLSSASNTLYLYKTAPAKKNWVIGRSQDADINFPFEPTISNKHALILANGAHLSIRDSNSLNGTWLNGIRVEKESPLVDRDTITIGTVSLKIVLNKDGALSVFQFVQNDETKLECVNLSLESSSLKKGARPDRLINDISLCIESGEFVGILGPSGAGKTTLLKLLNGTLHPSFGTVLINQNILQTSFEMIKDFIGYVPQDDILHPELTVCESLLFTARLRLPADTSDDQIKNIVDATIESLGLTHVRDVKIFNLSGGQRKRVSIASELLIRPKILYLDEPTSGLDPYVEESLMKNFSQLAENGTTVLITTHILYNLHLLDKVIILSQGELVFFGKPAEAIDFFKRDSDTKRDAIGIFASLENTSLKNQCHNGRISIGEKKKVAEKFSQKYRKSTYYDEYITGRFTEKSQDIYVNRNPADNITEVVHIPENRIPIQRQKKGRRFISGSTLLTLTKRHFKVRLSFLKRSIIYLIIPLILSLITLNQNIKGFISAEDYAHRMHEIEKSIVYKDTHFDYQLKQLLSPDGINDTRSIAQILHGVRYENAAHLPVPLTVLIMFLMASIFFGITVSCLEISGEKSIFTREHFIYLGIGEYLISKIPYCFLVTALQNMLFAMIILADPTMRQVGFPALWGTMTAISWACVFIGLFISSLDPSNGQYSFIIAILAVLPQLFLSGGLGPDFFKGMSGLTKTIAGVLPARWGLEMFFKVVYSNHGIHDPINWESHFISDTVGFIADDRTYQFNMVVLFIQSLIFFGSCYFMLWTKDINKRR